MPGFATLLVASRSRARAWKMKVLAVCERDHPCLAIYRSDGLPVECRHAMPVPPSARLNSIAASSTSFASSDDKRTRL